MAAGQLSKGKSAQGTLNHIFSTAGGTLINQGTLMTKLSQYSCTGATNSFIESPVFILKMGELIMHNWMVMGKRDLANERQRVAAVTEFWRDYAVES